MYPPPPTFFSYLRHRKIFNSGGYLTCHPETARLHNRTRKNRPGRLRYSAGVRSCLVLWALAGLRCGLDWPRAVSFMKPRPIPEILLRPLAGLPLSDAFKKAAAQNCFDSLAEISALHLSELLALPGFDHRLWNELAEYLEVNGFGYLLNKKSPPRE